MFVCCFHIIYVLLDIYPSICIYSQPCSQHLLSIDVNSNPKIPFFSSMPRHLKRTWFEVGLTPFPVIVGNEGLGWDSLLKMVHNPGGDSNPGRGDNPSLKVLFCFLLFFFWHQILHKKTTCIYPPRSFHYGCLVPYASDTVTPFCQLDVNSPFPTEIFDYPAPQVECADSLELGVVFWLEYHPPTSCGEVDVDSSKKTCES